MSASMLVEDKLISREKSRVLASQIESLKEEQRIVARECVFTNEDKRHLVSVVLPTLTNRTHRGIEDRLDSSEAKLLKMFDIATPSRSYFGHTPSYCDQRTQYEAAVVNFNNALSDLMQAKAVYLAHLIRAGEWSTIAVSMKKLMKLNK